MNALALAGATLATGVLLLPGWVLARKCGLKQPGVAGLVFGAVVLHAFALALDALGLGLTRLTVGAAWMVLIGAVLAIPSARYSEATPTEKPLWRAHWPLLLPLIPAVAVVLWRAIAQPLSGLDTIFRWNWLAELIFTHGTLAFYPPTTPADFALYGWPDGISPVVSLLYFWNYAWLGTTNPVATAPVVVAQFAAIVALTFALARRTSDRAGMFAVALLVCSPVVLWATAMGQETGLTAIALGAMLLWLPQARSTESPPAIVAAGLAAALGGLAREYGLAWAALGVALAFARGLSLRAILLFAGAAALGALPWYARNAALTGNPFFNLDLAGLFPLNDVHASLMTEYTREYGLGHLPPNALALLLAHCLAGIVAAIAGPWVGGKRAAPLLIAAALVALLWVASLPYTAAGFVGSLRVLNPALVCAAVLGGIALARWIPERRHLAGASLGLLLFAIDAALRGLALPAHVYRHPPATWPHLGGAVHAYHADPLFKEFARVTAGRRVLVLGPDALLTRLGMRCVPLWSPEVDFVFDPSIDGRSFLQRLHDTEIGFVLLKRAPVNERFIARSAPLNARHELLRLVWLDPEHELFVVPPVLP